MNDFEIDLDSDIGTSVSKLKGKEQKIITETDIDYEKILDSINNSETIKQVNTNYNTYDNSDRFTSSIRDIRPKKEINMGQFIRNVETDLDKFNDINFNEPLPINFNNPENNNSTQADLFSKYFNYEQINIKEHKNLIICILLFMLLNNKFMIETIYNIPYVNRYQSPYLNLFIRSLIFGIILYLIKV